MEDFVYDIKISCAEDVINLFKILEINQENSEYIYAAMINPNIYGFIDQVTEIYIDKKVYTIFYDIIDGWFDNIDKITSYKNIQDLTLKISKILVKILHSDMVECENIYIDHLDKYFNIKYYAEKMIG